MGTQHPRTPTAERSRRRAALIAGFAAFTAVLGVLNLATEFVGGPVWTLVAFGGALSGLVCANEIRKRAQTDQSP